MDLPWLDPFVDSWRARSTQDRVPHAVLLLGRRGVGKRCTASWMVRHKLDLAPAAEGPRYPPDRPEHADVRWISPPEGKHTIGVDAIRELVSDLNLTSYQGGGKVAVIEPANAMTINAANGLLKTLEEPPGDALIILVADKVSGIPATILSRCQRCSIPIPAEATSLAWLNQVHPGDNWSAALRMVGNAPLAAIAAADDLALNQAMEQAFSALPQSAALPLDIAAKWSKQEPQFVLDWMSGQLRKCILQTSGGGKRAREIAVPDSVLRRIDRRNLFCYLDTVDRLRNQPAGSFNVQLTLEGLLIDWADHLRNCRKSGDLAVRPLIFGTR